MTRNAVSSNSTRSATRSPHLKVLYWVDRHQWLAYQSVIAWLIEMQRTFQESFGASPQLAHMAAAFAVEFVNQLGLFEGGRGGD